MSNKGCAIPTQAVSLTLRDKTLPSIAKRQVLVKNKNGVFFKTLQAILEYESAIPDRNQTCYEKTLYKLQTILENKCVIPNGNRT